MSDTGDPCIQKQDARWKNMAQCRLSKISQDKDVHRRNFPNRTDNQ